MRCHGTQYRQNGVRCELSAILAADYLSVWTKTDSCRNKLQTASYHLRVGVPGGTLARNEASKHTDGSCVESSWLNFGLGSCISITYLMKNRLDSSPFKRAQFRIPGDYDTSAKAQGLLSPPSPKRRRIMCAPVKLCSLSIFRTWHFQWLTEKNPDAVW
jgi:hypothetical protein